MSLPADLSLYAIGTLGHVAVCVSALNRVQGSVAEHSVEKVGAELRAMMPWISKKKLVDSDKK